MNQRIWTQEEDEYIKNNFGKITFSEMSKKLDCAITTVQNRAIQLGFEIEKRTQKRWTKEEIELLKTMAPTYLNKTIAKKLGRSLQEVNKKARQLGIKLIFRRPVWKKWKIKFLRENINKMSITQICRELDVDYYKVMDKLEELGIEYHYESNKWTLEEEQLLIELSKYFYPKEISKILNRTEGAIRTKAQKMGIEYAKTNHQFTEEELKYIKDNWTIIPVNQIARDLKVSRIMIQKQADLMNLPKLGNNPYRKWTDKEIEELRILSKEKTRTELAKHFKTTNEAITSIAYHKNIKLIDGKIIWTEEDINLLREYAKTMSIIEIAEKMDRKTSSIRQQAKRNNIVIPKNKKHQESVWTTENSETLKELINQDKTLLQIAKIMNKKDGILIKKAKELGLEIKREDRKEWNEHEIQKLIELSKTKKLSELVYELERTSLSIKHQASKLGITIIPDRKNWTKEEYQQLEKLLTIDKKTPKEIAEILGRTEDSIIIKINRKGLKNETYEKKFWTEEEEQLLSDLWGNVPIEKIAKQLDRTVSSLLNKARQLKLGAQIENNYDGIKISELCDIFNIRRELVSVHWVALGLKVKTRYITQSKSYLYVEIKDLYDFLEHNQNIWDSRVVEKNIFGKEPVWFQEKRKTDAKLPPEYYFGLEKLTKQQLIMTRNILQINPQIIIEQVNQNLTEPPTEEKYQEEPKNKTLSKKE